MRLIDADELITAFPCGENVRTESVRATINHMPTIEISKDCISRDYVRLIESDEDAYYGDWNETYEKGFIDAINKVLNAPSVLPSRAEGEWIKEARK